MSMYAPKARETAIKAIDELYAKLANLIPTEEFGRDDIRGTMMYLKHFRDDLEKEQKSRNEYGKG